VSVRREVENLTDSEKQLLRKMLDDEIFYKEVIDNIYICDKVGIQQFIEDENYLGSGDEIWPAIKNDLIKIYELGVREAFMVEGIGAGKSTKTALALCYELFKLGRLKNPQRYYGLRSKTKIAVINMSIRATQAKDVLFDDIQSLIGMSPWFNKFFKPDQKVHSKLKFPNNIFAIPGNSQESLPIGFTLKAAALDEAAHFMTKSHIGDDMDQSRNVYLSLLKRLRSRFMDYLLIVCTSPRLVEDLTEKMREKALKSNGDMFWIRRPLWKAKPKGYYANDYFVYDERHQKIIGSAKDVIECVFGKIDGFEKLCLEEVQYLVNLMYNYKPEAVSDYVIDETLEVVDPGLGITRADADLSVVNILDSISNLEKDDEFDSIEDISESAEVLTI